MGLRRMAWWLALLVLVSCKPEPAQVHEAHPGSSSPPEAAAPAIDGGSVEREAPGPVEQWLVLGSQGTCVASWDGETLRVTARSERPFLFFRGEVWEIASKEIHRPIRVCGRDAKLSFDHARLRRTDQDQEWPLPPVSRTVRPDLVVWDHVGVDGFLDGAVFLSRSLWVADCSLPAEEGQHPTSRTSEIFVARGDAASPIDDGLGHLGAKERQAIAVAAVDEMHERGEVGGRVQPHIAGVVLRERDAGLTPLLDVHNTRCQSPCNPWQWTAFTPSNEVELAARPPWLVPGSGAPPWWKRRGELAIGSVRGLARLGAGVSLPRELQGGGP